MTVYQFLVDSYDFSTALYLIEAEWRIYASVNLTIIGSDKGLSSGCHHTII